LAIAGQVPTRFLGTEYFQETHPERIFRDCSHYCEAAYTAVQAVTMSRLAIQTAITKRGVGLVCIPGDTMAQPAAIDLPSHPFFTDPPRIRPTDDDLEKLAQVINSARRPVIFGAKDAAALANRSWRCQKNSMPPLDIRTVRKTCWRPKTRTAWE